MSPNPLDDPLYAPRHYEPGLHIPPSCVVHRRAVTDQVGGWRDYRELTEFPETELWHRTWSAGFRFAFVPRLSAIKFPAGLRRNVYRERPCHEQAAWLERIRREPDLGSAELLAVACDYLPPHRMFYRKLAGHFWHETWRRLRRRIARRMAVSQAAGATVDELRRIKGLEPARRDKLGPSLESS